MNLRRRLYRTSMRIAAWQPWPYVGWSYSGEPMSWWFWSFRVNKDGEACGATMNWLGETWYNVWFKVCKVFMYYGNGNP